MSIEELGEIADLAKEFCHVPENWEAYQELKTSESNSLPAEFMLLCAAVEKAYGGPK